MHDSKNSRNAGPATAGTGLIPKMIVSLVSVGVVAATAQLVIGDDGPPRIANRVDRVDGEASHKLVPAIKIARSSQAALEDVKDYEAVFTKQELVGRTTVRHTMRIKLRDKPFSVYLRYGAPHDGREVIYMEGRNNGKLLAHDTGVKAIAGTVALDPRGSRAMEESRYPITMIGITNMLAKIIDQWESELKVEDVEVKYYPNAKIGDMDCKVIQSSHPKPQDGVRFHMTRLYLDRATNLPVRVEQYAFPTRTGTKPALVEEYTYANLKTNLGLTDRDFDIRNPEYGF